MATDSRHYVKADLIDHADIDAVREYEVDKSVHTVSRKKIIESALGLTDYDIERYSTGAWQGTMLFAFRTAGYVWLLRDSYGSCSYCDGLLAADSAASYAETMMNNAYAFESVADAEAFLNQLAKARDNDGHDLSINPYFWRRVESAGRDMLADL